MYPKSQGPRGRGPEVLGILGPRPSGPWDLKYLGLKVRGPKVQGPRAQGLMALESSLSATKDVLGSWDWGRPAEEEEEKMEVAEEEEMKEEEVEEEEGKEEEGE